MYAVLHNLKSKHRITMATKTEKQEEMKTARKLNKDFCHIFPHTDQNYVFDNRRCCSLETPPTAGGNLDLFLPALHRRNQQSCFKKKFCHAIEGFHVTSYQANFASHHSRDRHVGFLLAWNGKGKHNKMSRYFLFSSYHNTKL